MRKRQSVKLEMQISHINVEGKFASKEQAWKMLNYIASQGVIYFAFNGKISICKNNHSFFGDKCPKCGEPMKTQYSRVVGELRCNCPMHQ